MPGGSTGYNKEPSCMADYKKSGAADWDIIGLVAWRRFLPQDYCRTKFIVVTWCLAADPHCMEGVSGAPKDVLQFYLCWGQG